MDAALESDLALIRRYTSGGDAEAMTELVRRYAGMVFGVAKRVTRNPHDAEDVAQSCFLELLRRGAAVMQTAETESAAGWIHATALHRAMDAIRNDKTRERHEHEAARLREQQSLDSAQWWQQLSPLVDASIDRLPDQLKMPLILHFLQGKTQGEIAASLKISQPTVSRRLEQAVESLRKRLRELELSGACAILPTLLTQYAMTTPPPTLTAALGKMAVAGVGTQALAFPTSAAIPSKVAAAKWLTGTSVGYILLAFAVVLGTGWAAIHFGAGNSSVGQAVPGKASSTLSGAKAAADHEDGGDLRAAKIELRVADAERAAIWYRDHLGFHIDAHSDPKIAALHRDLCHITLRPDPSAATSANIPVDESEDVDDIYAEFVGRKTPVLGKPALQASAAGSSYQFSLKDPDGNLLTFGYSK